MNDSGQKALSAYDMATLMPAVKCGAINDAILALGILPVGMQGRSPIYPASTLDRLKEVFAGVMIGAQKAAERRLQTIYHVNIKDDQPRALSMEFAEICANREHRPGTWTARDLSRYLSAGGDKVNSGAVEIAMNFAGVRSAGTTKTGATLLSTDDIPIVICSLRDLGHISASGGNS